MLQTLRDGVDVMELDNVIEYFILSDLSEATLFIKVGIRFFEQNVSLRADLISEDTSALCNCLIGIDLMVKRLSWEVGFEHGLDLWNTC